MEALWNAALYLWVFILLAGIFGIIRPKSFERFFGNNSSRKNLIIFSVVWLVVFGGVLGMVEPTGVKNARLAREEKENTAEQLEAEQKPEELKPDPRYYWHEVTKVVDGDTIKARVDGKEESIRVIGIDSPESTTQQECFGNEASAKAKEFLQGKWIQLEPDNSQSNRDKYGRLLRYIWFDTGTDFGRRMIEEGYAHEYTYQSPYSKQAQYKTTHEQAKKNLYGLWSPDTCDGKDQKPKPKTQSTPAPSTNNVTPTPQPAAKPTSNCDPNYTPCVPKVSYDLDCADIGFSVTVIGSDPHNFDGNNDGYGCESY